MVYTVPGKNQRYITQAIMPDNYNYPLPSSGIIFYIYIKGILIVRAEMNSLGTERKVTFHS